MKKKVRKKTGLIFILISLVLLLSLVQLVISHHLATAGERVRQLEKKASQIEQENRRLQKEISQMGSLAKISSEAEKLGLEKSIQVLHLTPQLPVALKK